MSEPSGVIRHNDPARNSWYTRDVAAITNARGLNDAAPYFVDEDAAPGTLDAGKPAWPQGGLTVIAFPNNHLSYLITWYALAFPAQSSARISKRYVAPGVAFTATLVSVGAPSATGA